MATLDEYLDQNGPRFEEELCQLLRIPSVSAMSTHKQDIRSAAGWVLEQFQSLGFKAEFIETAGHPIVYAESPPRCPRTDGAGLWPLRRAAS